MSRKNLIPKAPPPVVLFDGVCNFCSFWVQFIVKRDPEGRFRFAALQSGMGQKILREMGILGDRLTTMILVEENRCFKKSTAFLRIARHLEKPWPLLFAFIAIPAPIRDFFYDWVARNRYRWFGKRETCFVPPPDFKERFLQ